MNLTCRTCGTTLHSEISRDYGMCGACRQANEWREGLAQAAATPAPSSAAAPATLEARPDDRPHSGAASPA